jgi:hypothetical protein
MFLNVFLVTYNNLDPPGNLNPGGLKTNWGYLVPKHSISPFFNFFILSGSFFFFLKEPERIKKSSS